MTLEYPRLGTGKTRYYIDRLPFSVPCVFCFIAVIIISRPPT